jgi:predicted DNA-binding transcriptional regulator AlpA
MPNHSERASADRLLRPGQVQRLLGVAASTLWNYVHQQGLLTIAQHTAGGHARYRESEVARPGISDEAIARWRDLAANPPKTKGSADFWYRPFTSGDNVTADCDDVLFAGTIIGFNGSGHTALIRLTSDAPGYRAGVEVPMPVRLLRAAA